jgi:hypothetical protein
MTEELTRKIVAWATEIASYAAELPGEHPAETEPERSTLLQPLSIPRSQSDRALLQQDQAMPARGNPL